MKRIYAAVLVLAMASLACTQSSIPSTPTKIVRTALPTPTKAVLASKSPEPTLQNTTCVTLRGAVNVRNAHGDTVAWFTANTPVCVLPGVIQGRVWLADGSGTILAACVFGPQKDCK